MKRSYFVVEGPHDAEVIGRLLALRGFKGVRNIESLDGYWKRLVPSRFPPEGDLLKRVPVPLFFTASGYSVAVRAAGGLPKIGERLAADIAGLDEVPDGLGVMVDADYKMSIHDRYDEIVRHLPGTYSWVEPGRVSSGHPRTGIFILPDNRREGTLEDLLVATARQAYPTLLNAAYDWISKLKPDDESIFVDKNERKEFAKPAGKNKAIVGCIASILRPGKAIQVSIQDNRWFKDPAALGLKQVRQLEQFVHSVAGLGVESSDISSPAL